MNGTIFKMERTINVNVTGRPEQSFSVEKGTEAKIIRAHPTLPTGWFIVEAVDTKGVSRRWTDKVERSMEAQ